MPKASSWTIRQLAMPFVYKLTAKHYSESPITAIAFSADSVYIAFTNENGEIFIVKSSDGSVALSLKREHTDITSITWTSLFHKEFVFADSEGYLSTVSFNEDGLMKVRVPHLFETVDCSQTSRNISFSFNLGSLKNAMSWIPSPRSRHSFFREQDQQRQSIRTCKFR